MAASMQTFVNEISHIFRELYAKNLTSRSRFKEACEVTINKKMPRGTENEKRKLVAWLCRLYDHEQSVGGVKLMGEL